MAKRRKKHPEHDEMLADLERREANYCEKIGKEAVDWPSKGFSTADLVRRRVRADWDALMATNPNPDPKGTHPMRMNELYPTAYLKAADIGDGSLGDEVVVTIRNVRREANKFDESRQNVLLSFEEYGKELILNRTNADVLAAAFGDESDAWSGQEITLFIASVRNPEGRAVLGVRVRAAKPNGAKQEAAAAQAYRQKQVTQPPPAPDLDDDIPF